MKKCFLITLSFTLLFTLYSNERIVVLNMKAVNIDKNIADAATEILSTTIAQEKIYQVIERGQLDQIFNELKLTLGDEFDDNQAIEIGKLAKADSVMLGSITKIGNTISVNARLIEVITGSIIAAKRVSTENINDLNEEIIELALSFDKNRTPKKNDLKRVEDVIVDISSGTPLKTCEVKLTKTKLNIRPKRAFNTFKTLIISPNLNDVEIKYILIEFKDKTQVELLQPFKIEAGKNHIITFSQSPKPVKKIEIQAKTDRSITKSWTKSKIIFSGK